MNKNRALIIGVGSDLPSTVTDANGLAAILKDPQRCNFDPASVQLLTEADATRSNILAALDDLIRSRSSATIIIYFSGHGYTVKTSIGESYFLMPHGYNLANLAKTAISGHEFVGKLADIRAKRLLLLLDCCHAGGVIDTQIKVSGLELAKLPLPPQAERLFAQGGGRVVICSSRSNEVSLAARPYSLFTRALIDCLSGEGVAKLDGYVRVLDLALYAREKVPVWSTARQHPIADIDKADNFVVAYYAAGAKQPKPLNLPLVDPTAVEATNQPFGTLDMSISSMDLRAAQGTVIGAQGPVTQTFGSQTITFDEE